MTKHQIIVDDLNKSSFEPALQIDEETFEHLFSQDAFAWFCLVVSEKYPDAIVLQDKTLAGFHFEQGDNLVIKMV